MLDKLLLVFFLFVTLIQALVLHSNFKDHQTADRELRAYRAEAGGSWDEYQIEQNGVQPHQIVLLEQKVDNAERGYFCSLKYLGVVCLCLALVAVCSFRPTKEPTTEDFWDDNTT